MSEWIANARMYAVTPAVEVAWRELLGHIARESGVALHYLRYPAPQPLETLWAREDLGAVFMCGYPVALKLAPVTALAAPIPRAPWAQGRALYRSDLIVREDSPYQRLEDTFGGRAGWTVSHSQSGFNAFRHELLAYRSAARPTLYAEMLGDLVTARRVLDAVREGEHRRRAPGCVLAPLDRAACPGAHRGHPRARLHAAHPDARVRRRRARAGASMVARLRAAFLEAQRRPWFGALGGYATTGGICAGEQRRIRGALGMGSAGAGGRLHTARLT